MKVTDRDPDETVDYCETLTRDCNRNRVGVSSCGLKEDRVKWEGDGDNQNGKSIKKCSSLGPSIGYNFLWSLVSNESIGIVQLRKTIMDRLREEVRTSFTLPDAHISETSPILLETDA